MGIKNIFRPKQALTGEEMAHGLRMLTLEGMVSMGFTSITTSGFLASYALALGASNFQVGVLGAIPFITQPFQVLAILLVEKLHLRKAITVITWFIAQLFWIPIALIPVFIEVPGARAISMLLVLMAVRGMVAAITNGAWGSWERDLVPEKILGRFFARRLALAAIVAAVFGLSASFFIYYWRAHLGNGNVVLGYTYMLLFGAVFLGLASPIFMSLMPEPMMPPAIGPQSFSWKTITTPLRDRNFALLLRFLLFWGFASNLALPFFAVYMLQRLGLPLVTVIALNVVSQLFSILFLRIWGPFADRFGSKVVLSLSISLYLLVILGWTFLSILRQFFNIAPMIIVLHVFSGIATVGITLTLGTLGLKLAPVGRSTSYLTAASLANSLGSGLGPLAGGLLADYFRVRQLALDFTWVSPDMSIKLGVINLTGLDFLFAFTFVIGLITLNMMAFLHEDGEVSRNVVLDELMSPTKPIFRQISSVPGINLLNLFPFGYFRRIPGLDVAVGVTAYQFADLAKMMTQITRVVTWGHNARAKVAKTLENSLTQALETREDVEKHGAQVAQQAARGVSHALDETPESIERLIRPAVVGIVQALKQAQAKPEESFYGIGYGVVQGANEIGIDPVEIIVEVIAGARDAAQMLGLDETEVAGRVAQGALAAAKAAGEEQANRVKEAIVQAIVQEMGKRL